MTVINNKHILGRFSLIVAMLVLISACSTMPSVERMDADTATDLSGDWNDTDSRLVSREMIQDALSHPWLFDYMRKNERQRPAVIVGDIRNLSHEHINVGTFVNDIERALINSGQVDFVASSEERNQIREERRDQDIHASAATRKAAGQELGADYMLKGTINTIIDAVKGKQTRYYQVDMTLISLVDNRKVWVGQK